MAIEVEYHTPAFVIANWRRFTKEELIDTLTAYHEGMAGLQHARFVHTYKGEGLTACGLEVVGLCPDCVTGNGERT